MRIQKQRGIEFKDRSQPRWSFLGVFVAGHRDFCSLGIDRQLFQDLRSTRAAVYAESKREESESEREECAGDFGMHAAHKEEF